MARYRVGVTGGRSYAGKAFLCAALDTLLGVKEKLTLVVGDCPTGADRFARDWAVSGGVRGKVFLVECQADWNNILFKKTGMTKIAGLARNTEMWREFKPDIVLAFPGGPGTAHAAREASAIGIEVKFMDDEEPLRRRHEW
jgi:hypothetical protein